jgi:putative endopeptidase
MDRSVPPGTNFYTFANGTWAKATPVPADRSNYGMFTLLDDLSTERSRDILETAARQPGSRIGDLYASFVDEAAVNAKGAAPLRPLLAGIKGVATKQALAAEMGKLLRIGVHSPFGIYVGQDDKAPEAYIATMVQSGLGMPDRDYYLKTDAKLLEAKTAYAATSPGCSPSPASPTRPRVRRRSSGSRRRSRRRTGPASTRATARRSTTS